MKRLIILLLTLSILCFCLSACVAPDEEMETSSPESTVMTEAGETDAIIPETQPEMETVTMPPMEMPTQPDADYQLPPGEKPGGDVITE